MDHTEIHNSKWADIGWICVDLRVQTVNVVNTIELNFNKPPLHKDALTQDSHT